MASLPITIIGQPHPAEASMLRVLLIVIVSVAAIFLASRMLSGSGAPTVGAQAPEFTLSSQHGSEVSLRDYRGKWVVLYFYPKDQTPG